MITFMAVLETTIYTVTQMTIISTVGLVMTAYTAAPETIIFSAKKMMTISMAEKAMTIFMVEPVTTHTFLIFPTRQLGTSRVWI
jgi:hypothetical protein